MIQIDFSFMATENDLPKRTILNATDVQTLRKFVFEIGRTFGIVLYDKEAPLKTMARDLCKVIGGMSMRSAPTGHSQSQESDCDRRINWPMAIAPWTSMSMWILTGLDALKRGRAPAVPL